MKVDTKWDKRFLGLAAHVASWSKDPSTQCGAILVDGKRRVISLGFNGFPRYIEDRPDRLEDREIKYQLILHAEINALLFASRDLPDLTLYTWPFAPCSRCAVQVIQAGVRRVVAPPCPVDKTPRWGTDLVLSQHLFHEAGVVYDLVRL